MYLIRYALLTAVLCLTAILAACGQAAPELAATDGALSWPPDEALARAASDDAPFFRGSDYATAGGGKTQVAGTGLVLGPHLKPSWAIFSLQGFGPGTEMDKLEIDFTLVPGSPDQNTRLYIGFANYAKQTWEWMENIEPQKDTIDLPDFADYYSPSGAVHVACILSGNGTTRINSLRFYRTGPGATVPVPANLLANPVPGSIELSWDAVDFVDGYNIYRNSVDDFGTATKHNLLPNAQNSYADSTVTKDTDYFYWVTAVRTVESAPSSSVAAHSIDTTVAIPQNLQGTAAVMATHLTWDPVPDVIGYKVERSRYVDFSAPEVFQCTEPQYDDINIFGYEQVYYYRVIGVGVIEESLPSAGIDLFVPSVDLAAPANFQVDAAHTQGDFVTFTWDYAVDPTLFNIYVHRVPNFPLDQSLIPPTTIVAGNRRSVVRFELPAEGGTFYARMCALDDDSNLGHMTPAISFSTMPYIVFAPQEAIGATAEPTFAATRGDDEIAVAYFDSGAVRLASKTTGAWTADEAVGLNSNFGTYLDLAYGGAKYCIAAFQEAAGDCWTSIGNHGTWGATRIHGDGGTGFGHQVSGVKLSAAASETEFGVTHWISDSPLPILVQTRANSGGAWDQTTATTIDGPNSDMSLAFSGTDLTLCVSDYENGNLLAGSRSGSYSMSPMNVTSGDFICQYNLLSLVDGNLLTPAVDANTSMLYAYRHDGSNWQREDIYAATSTISYMDIAVEQQKVLITYLCPPQSRWYVAYFDGTQWRTSSLVVMPIGTSLTEVHPVFLPTGEPYIIFRKDTGELFGAMGNLL